MNVVYTDAQKSECAVFGSKAKVCRYVLPDGVCSEPLTKGCNKTCHDICIEIQPPEGEKTIMAPEGQYSEGSYKFWYDPYQNMINGTPFFLRMADSRFIADGFNAGDVRGFSDVIEWLGQLYVINALSNWQDTDCSTACTDGKIGMQTGIISLYGDTECNGDTPTDIFEYEGDLV